MPPLSAQKVPGTVIGVAYTRRDFKVRHGCFSKAGHLMREETDTEMRIPSAFGLVLKLSFIQSTLEPLPLWEITISVNQ